MVHDRAGFSCQKCDPAGPWQEALASPLAEHAGFSQANVREGLRLALTDWNEAALQRLIERELGPRRATERVGYDLTTVLCAGAIPMPTLLQITLCLLVRSPVLVKPASRDPVTPQLVRESGPFTRCPTYYVIKEIPTAERTDSMGPFQNSANHYSGEPNG